MVDPLIAVLSEIIQNIAAVSYVSLHACSPLASEPRPPFFLKIYFSLRKTKVAVVEAAKWLQVCGYGYCCYRSDSAVLVCRLLCQRACACSCVLFSY